jgi:hypothetical protein
MTLLRQALLRQALQILRPGIRRTPRWLESGDPVAAEQPLIFNLGQSNPTLQAPAEPELATVNRFNMITGDLGFQDHSGVL